MTRRHRRGCRRRGVSREAISTGTSYVVAFGGLVLGQNYRALRAAQIVVWLVAVSAGWWFFYRFFRQIDAIWRSDPKRRARLVGASLLAVFVLLTSVYLVAIKFEVPGWALLVFIPVDLYLRARRPESP